MATIKNLGENATEIRIDRLNGVLFLWDEPKAALIAGSYYFSVMNEDVFMWMGGDDAGSIKAELKPQSFFDNILKIYMNPAMHDTPETEEARNDS